MAANPEIQTAGIQTCYHHPDRQAVVRCPLCHKYYCRECVTEHNDRMLCADCLNHHLQLPARNTRRWIYPFIVLIQGGAGFVGLWYGFYLLGRILLAFPSAFHEGTLWQSLWWLNQ